jgi:tetratricopeptide (TPR) repeat protein
MSGAVFLSYASQDAEAAQRVCEALRATGVEVWFDQSELRGGDAWDQSIRRQIKACALFVPIVSARTQARREGYFRLEWKLADDRTHLMAKGTRFILPVCIHGTRDGEAIVPDSFTAVQWTRLEGGRGAEAFAARVGKLLSGEETAPGSGERGTQGPALGSSASPPPRQRRSLVRRLWYVFPILALMAWQKLHPRRSPKEVAAMVALAPSIAARADAPPSPAAAGTDAPRALPSSNPKANSPARQLLDRARAMSLDKYASTADDFAAAESLIKQALALDPNDAEAWAISSQLNTAYQNRGFDFAPERAEAARSQAERALKLAPDSVEGLYALGRWQRDPATQEKTLREVLARAPDHPGALGSMGTLCDRDDRLPEALAHDERLARQPDRLPLARYEEFLAYFYRGYFAEAERCVRESIAAAPAVNSLAGLAMLLLTNQGDPRAALGVLTGISAADRGDHRAVWITTYAHLLARQPEEALHELNWLTSDFVQDNWFFGPKAYWVGRAQLQAGRLEAARIAFETGLSVTNERLRAAPDDARLHDMRGELLAWLGRADEARREARTATELMSGYVRNYWFESPAKIYAALGQPGEALPLLEQLRAPPGTTVGWPLTPALLKLDPLWDKIRGDPRFAALASAATPAVAAPALGSLPRVP